MTRGHTISNLTGQAIAKERRNTRYRYTRERVNRKPIEPSDVKHFVTPSGGMPAFNTTTKVMGSASCRRWDSDSAGKLTDSNKDETIYNPWGALPGSIFVLVEQNEAGCWVIIPPAFEVRIKPDKTALQKSYDGGLTWVDWATIGAC